jgi:hypothetical protein
MKMAEKKVEQKVVPMAALKAVNLVASMVETLAGKMADWMAVRLVFHWAAQTAAMWD